MSPLFDLGGKRALVTGSSQGIGLALAEGLAAHGASVVINGRDPAKVETAVKDLRSKGYEAHGLAFDVTLPSVADSIDRIEADIGAIDILVNNAGMQFRTPLEDFPADKWEELLRTNISSVFYTSQAVARHMIRRGAGKIINIGSVQSELARPSIAPYTATKGAVKNLTRGMATDWAKYGLQINGIGPGYFRTPAQNSDKGFIAALADLVRHARAEERSLCSFRGPRTCPRASKDCPHASRGFATAGRVAAAADED